MTNLIELAEKVEGLELKALSIRQPWCHRIFNEGKDVENRDWPTKGRGWVLVHSSKNESEDRGLIRELQLPLGGIVGAMKIVDCVEEMNSRWFVGDYGFVIGDSLSLPLTPCRGKLGFFTLEADVAKQVATALRARAMESDE